MKHHIPPVLVLSFALALPLAAQDLPYSSGSTGADGSLEIPRSMYDHTYHASVFHEEAGKLTMFGGSGPNGITNDTLVLNIPHWSTLNPVTSPPLRYDHAMVYDAARKEAVVFGGYNNQTGVNLDDTWVFNGTEWSVKSPATKPSARYSHAMAYDSLRQETILFGGSSGSDETWAWNGTTWTQKASTIKPPAMSNHAMAYDSVRQRVVMVGNGETWEWNGTGWAQRSFASQPSNRGAHAMAYDTVRREIVLFGGDSSGETWTYGATGWVLRQVPAGPSGRWDAAMAWDPVRQMVVLTGGNSGPAETWLWNGQTWTLESGPWYPIDMAAKPDGIWNYTSINVPSGVNVYFLHNPLNTPVQWLASGPVTISGTISLDGHSAPYYQSVEPGTEAEGGPGGFAGGLGGRDFSISGSYLGSAGGGPGGGAAGPQDEHGRNGTYSGTYGNTFLQPLIGGSGGGGGSSAPGANGGNGGAGGGAILISSSGDITISGRINARGGSGGYNSSGYSGGSGSGGAIRLVADRVQGSGNVDAGSGGRVRIEGYYRSLSSQASPSPSSGPPTAPFPGLTGATLTVTHVAGAGVRQPALGTTANPDVIFTEAGPVVITVKGQNVPNGTPVRARVTTSTGVLQLPEEGGPEVLMQNNTAAFTVAVPAGVGTIQAYANIPLAPVIP